MRFESHRTSRLHRAIWATKFLIFWGEGGWETNSALAPRPKTGDLDPRKNFGKLHPTHTNKRSRCCLEPKKNEKTRLLSQIHVFFQTKSDVFTAPTYYETRNDYTNNSETILLCNRCVCNWKINSQRILLCNWRLQKVPHGGALITQKNSCQKALCNRCPVQLGN